MTATARLPLHRTSPTVASPGVAFRVVTTFEELEPLRERWDAFVASAGSDLYFSFDWCQVWWRHYGAGRELHILVVSSEGRWVALLPLMVDRVLVGPLSVRLARLVGADSTMSVVAPPIVREFAPRVVDLLLRFALEQLACDALSLSSLGAESALPDLVRDACARVASPARLVRDASPGVYTVFHLPPTFDDYLARLNKSARGNYRRDERQLAESLAAAHDTVTAPSAVRSAFEHFQDLHTRYWRAQRRLGHFDDWPGSRAFTRDLLERLCLRGDVEIDRLISRDRLLASELVFRFGSTRHWRLPAREPDPDLERLGLGRVMLVRLIRRAIESGAARIEAGPGHYEYKLRLGGTQYPLTSLLIARNTPLSRSRSALLRSAADLLHLFYYRIWFSRLAPRLPFRRRPLWKSWIRTRI